MEAGETLGALGTLGTLPVSPVSPVPVSQILLLSAPNRQQICPFADDLETGTGETLGTLGTLELTIWSCCCQLLRLFLKKVKR